MKSPFSAWFCLYVMIGLCAAAFVYEAFFRHAGVAHFDTAVSETSGVVRAIHQESGDAISETRANVILADGAMVDATVAPGCLVLVGDRVNVHVLQALPAMQKSYLVTSAGLRHKN